MIREHAVMREVTGTTEQGRRVYLTLACGHRKLHQSRAAVPKRAYCYDCEGDRACVTVQS